MPMKTAPSFNPFLGILHPLTAPRDLARMESIYTGHLKTSLRDQNPSLSPGLTLILESCDPWTTALLTTGLGTFRRPLQPRLVSYQFRAALGAGASVLAQHLPGAEPGVG